MSDSHTDSEAATDSDDEFDPREMPDDMTDLLLRLQLRAADETSRVGALGLPRDDATDLLRRLVELRAADEIRAHRALDEHRVRIHAPSGLFRHARWQGCPWIADDVLTFDAEAYRGQSHFRERESGAGRDTLALLRYTLATLVSAPKQRLALLLDGEPLADEFVLMEGRYFARSLDLVLTILRDEPPRRATPLPGLAPFASLPDDVTLGYVASALAPNDVACLARASKALRASLLKAPLAVPATFAAAFGVAGLSAAECLSQALYIHQWSVHTNICAELHKIPGGIDVARAFGIGTVADGLDDAAFFRGASDAFRARAMELARAAEFRECSKYFAFHVDDGSGGVREVLRNQIADMFLDGPVRATTHKYEAKAVIGEVQLELRINLDLSLHGGFGQKLEADISVRIGDDELPLCLLDATYGSLESRENNRKLLVKNAARAADALGLTGTPVNLVGFLLYLLAGAARWITPSHSSVREPTFLRMMRRQMFLVTWCFGTGQGDGDVTSVYFDRMEEFHAFRCCAPPPGALLRTRPNPTMEQDGRWWVPYVED